MQIATDSPVKRWDINECTDILRGHAKSEFGISLEVHPTGYSLQRGHYDPSNPVPDEESFESNSH